MSGSSGGSCERCAGGAGHAGGACCALLSRRQRLSARLSVCLLLRASMRALSLSRTHNPRPAVGRLSARPPVRPHTQAAIVSAVGVVANLAIGGGEQAVAYGLGATAGLAYLGLLARTVDTLGAGGLGEKLAFLRLGAPIGVRAARAGRRVAGRARSAERGARSDGWRVRSGCVCCVAVSVRSEWLRGWGWRVVQWAARAAID